ncbi:MULTISPECIES: glycoside hydrolase family 43 protein [unclassified Sphingomonas]|uniref:glycoside hydrolase family 43 protein n=1 Tax=unclassified Sphingomonas TaxID=196159 RepID=UPI000700AC09|nr:MULTISPECIES: glycoside hydrolase 43 family protein [unclassified Sphingomonas]KQM66988.1 glycosyl hydrolase [Sphingomonas sp. Leaf16]KQN17934.1 glycosyl hydrolase [Sphingomonas sp. Leaf29]KQN23798.1 glycosyl hydrolase [Sphingomonas sp. Leaf32]
MRASTTTGAAMLAIALLTGSAGSAQIWQSDQGDGTYRNPVLFADYPDPDIICVGSDYFVTTTFANAPGLTLLHSKDLVNWRIFSHVVPHLDDRPEYRLADGKDAYRRGLFAASLRFHDGIFYVAVTPVGRNTRIYRSRDPRGPWQMNELDRSAFDPGLFIEPDGSAYIATSIGSDGTIRLLKLDAGLRRVVDDRKVHYVAGAEGSKIVRRGDYHYLFNAIPRRLGLTVSRARSLYGPWETRPQIDDRSGGHQGALVDTADGTWVGFVMLDAGAIGRTTNLSPIFWQDDWPVWGTPDMPGRVPARATKPVTGFPLAEPATSDDFSARQLGRQWQWNHNPDDSRWSLSARPGFLRLHPTQADGLWHARNTLTQKAQGPRSRAEVKLDIRHIASGDRCGFCTFGQYSATLAVTRDNRGAASLAMDVIESTEKGPAVDTRMKAAPFTGNTLWIGLDLDFTTDRGRLSYSRDGVRWQAAGGDFPLAFAWRTGTFQGQQMALSCYNPTPGKGHLDVDSFTLRAPRSTTPPHTVRSK